MKGKFKKSLAIFLSFCICLCGIPFAAVTSANAAATVTPRSAVGLNHTIILMPDGSVWACGQNNVGQLGTGDYNDQTRFSRCKDSDGNYINDAVDVAAGDNHSLVLRSNGTVWATGGNYNGQLGIGTNDNKPSFVKIASDVMLPSGTYHTIACGANHSAIIGTDGQLYTCGLNTYGWLGISSTNPSPYFSKTNLGNAVSVACGSQHTAAINSSGTLYTCGYNKNGQLCRNTGINTGSSALYFDNKFKATTSSASAVSCQPDITLAVIGGNLYKSSGGTGGFSLLGSLSQVGESSVAAVAGYASGYVTLKTDGTVYLNGNNTGLSNVASISTGPTSNHFVAIKNDGSVYVRGSNSKGQLGTGYTLDLSPYTQVTLPINDATINVSNNSFKSFINSISFGYFFKDSATVSISATQGGNDAPVSNSSIQYYVSDTAKSESSLASLTGWKNYTGSFSISAAKKQIVYAKITSAFGNTKYISSDGLVIYNPLEVTYSNVPDFVQTQSIDIEIPLKLNGNTVASVTKDDTDIGSDNYSIGDSSVTIKNAYLKNLAADNLTTLAINYNPVGVAWTNNSKGAKPLTEFQINIIGEKPINGKIDVGGNEFTSFSEQSDFKYFFKDNAAVSISATGENGSVIPNSYIAYYLSDEAKTLEQLKALTDWTGYTEAISIPATSKKIVYAKITNAYEGVQYLSSGGFVVYTEPKVSKTDEFQSFAKTNDKDAKVNVDLNDSKVADILLNNKSIGSTYYSIEGSTITLSQDYLKTLNSNKDYTFTIVYSTLGQTWSDDSQGSKPTSTFKLRVVDSLLTSTTFGDPNNSAERSVVGTANFESTINVTINWGSLAYSYSATWDPESQSWKNATWQHAEDADKIKIENRSSQSCNLLLDFTPSDDYKSDNKDNKDDKDNTINGTFLKTRNDKSTEVPGSKLSIDRLASEIVYLQLDGINDKNYSKGELTDQVFGVVTITIQE